MRPLGVWIIFFAFLAATLSGCGDSIAPGTTQGPAPPVVNASVDTARLTDVPLVYEAVGTVRADTTSTLSGKLMGTVKEILVGEGTRVNQGDPLVLIDKRQVTAHLQQAEAALAEARQADAATLSARKAAAAGADLARATYERYLQLIRDESASRQEFDEIKARHRQAEAAEQQAEQLSAAARQRVQQAQAAVSTAEIADTDAVIRAPYDGVVTAKLLEAGDLITPGTPVVSLESLEGHRVDIILTETYIGAVQLNQTLDVRVPAAFQDAVKGRVEAIGPAADPGSRSFLIKVRLPLQPSVRSGMFARVMVPIGTHRALLVRSDSVVIQGQLTGIFLLDDQQIARFRLVRTGRQVADSVEILSGLDPEARYVVNPPATLIDGARVEAMP